MWKPGRAHSAPLEVFTRTQKDLGGGKERTGWVQYSVAKRTRTTIVGQLPTRPLTLPDVCWRQPERPFEKYIFSHGILPRRVGLGIKGTEGKGERRAVVW
jgi:hypothetical protein